MQLKLSENIKFYRKKLELTQEELAENMSVTVGAVSKWESGANVPDVQTMMELANFFDISMDELLGYNMSSKKVNDMYKTIENLCNEHKFDEAISEAKTALIRFPHTFKILYAAANTYFFCSYEKWDKNNAEKAIDLFNKALDHISQNEDPKVNDYTIKSRICEMYSLIDSDKALEEFKKINYDGKKDTAIALLLSKSGKRDEALEYISHAIAGSFIHSVESFSNASYMLASSGKKKDIEQAIEMVDSIFKIIDAFTIEKLNYTHKLKATALSFKGWFYACLGNETEMKRCLDEAFEIAYELDKGNFSSDLSTGMRFYFSKEKMYSFDNVGIDVVSGIESVYKGQLKELNIPLNEQVDAVLKYWKELMEKKGMKE
ncbi:MAG: helix-turn-helix transcriptional regulator [Lachnospiraceae bacterium]|nr:helix-turn-helix transcriptional regulator [Lachnospiraceae bacterium]